jgi:hypothetical protein
MLFLLILIWGGKSIIHIDLSPSKSIRKVSFAAHQINRLLILTGGQNQYLLIVTNKGTRQNYDQIAGATAWDMIKNWWWKEII